MTFTCDDFAIVDMTMIYKDLASWCLHQDIICPQIIMINDGDIEIERVMESKKGVKFILIGVKCLLHRNLSEELREVVQAYEKDGCFSKIDMTLYYLIGAALAKSLEIQCPQIIFGETKINYALNTPYNSRTFCISLKRQTDLRENIKSLAHEIRHAWQHEKHPSIYFSGYNFDYIYTDLEKYLMQKAEIDADAYAYRIMNDVFRVRWSPNRIFPAVNVAVKKRCLKMSLKYTDELKLIGKMFEGVQR